MRKGLASAIGLLVVLAGLPMQGASSGSAPEDTQIPPLSVGTEASYSFVGEPTGLTHELRVGWNVSRVEEARVEVRQGEVPAQTGELVPTRAVRLEATNGSILHAGFARNEQGFARVTPDEAFQFEGLTRTDYGPAVGPLDAFVFEGEALPEGQFPLDEIVTDMPSGEFSGSLRDISEASVHVDWIETPGGWEAHVDLEGVVQYVGTDGDPFTVEYVFTPDCPLPARIGYPDVPGVDPFTAKRQSCDPGEGLARVDAPALDRPDTQPFDQRLPGRGDELPVPYGPAFDAFLRFPLIDSFTDANPNWAPECASLEPDPPVMTLAGQDVDFTGDWSWFFRIADHEGHVAQAWSTPTPLAEFTDYGYIRDVTRPDEEAYCGRGEEPIADGAEISSVNRLPRVTEAVLDRAEWSKEAVISQYRWTEHNQKTVLSRCSHSSTEGNFCAEKAPQVIVHLDGTIHLVDAEPEWYAGDFLHLAGDDPPS